MRLRSQDHDGQAGVSEQMCKTNRKCKQTQERNPEAPVPKERKMNKVSNHRSDTVHSLSSLRKKNAAISSVRIANE